MDLMTNYNKAESELYAHVGFTPDWVVCPIDDCTNQHWQLVDKTLFGGAGVKYADSLPQFYSDGDYYEDEIYTQRFYDRHVYRGERLTMIMCDPRVDGVKWFRFFLNDLEVK